MICLRVKALPNPDENKYSFPAGVAALHESTFHQQERKTINTININM